jgi:hypothetical protein
MTANIIAGGCLCGTVPHQVAGTPRFPFSVIAVTANEHREPDTSAASFVVVFAAMGAVWRAGEA